MSVVFLVYLFLVGRASSRVLIALFNFAPARVTFVFGFFASLVTLGSLLCGVLLVGTLTPLAYVSVLMVNGLLWVGCDYYCRRRVIPRLEEGEILTQGPQGFGIYAGVFVYAVLYITGLVLLYQSRSEGALTTPWQTIHPHYVYVFAGATLVLGWLSLTRLSVRSMTFLFMAHLFLLHSYLPLTHTLFYGADGWRHLASVQTIVAEQPMVEALLSDAPEVAYKGLLPYGQLWGLLALFSRTLGIPLIALIKWFVPVLWAVMLPLLLVEIAKITKLGRRGTFYLLWASLVPFALQAAGSFTLPVSFGLLAWLFMMVLVLKRTERPGGRSQLMVLAMFGAASLFGYSLYALLFWVGWGAAEVIRRVRHRGWQIAAIFATSIFAAASIPAVELVAGVSSFKPVIWLSAMKQIIGNFSGWYVATGPRPFDTTAGNILINQVPAGAFVPNLFTAHLWWLPIIAVLFFGLVFIGTWYALSRREPTVIWFGIMSFSLTIGYLISRYFLDGENLFSRRLDPALAIIYCVVTVLIMRYFDRNIASRPSFVKILPVFLILDTVIIATLYTLGPDTGTVRVGDARAMEYVWQKEKNNAYHCVIADTYPLLALEAISQKKIIGGGFPINEYFAQPELTAAWRRVATSVTSNDLAAAFEATGATNCWIVKDGNILNKVK